MSRESAHDAGPIPVTRKRWAPQGKPDPAVVAATRAAQGEFVTGRPVPGALEWVTRHQDEYWGKWLAVGPHGLIAAADTLDELEWMVGGSLKRLHLAHLV